MEYCEDCGGLMFPTKKRGKEILKCKRCGASKDCEGELDRDSFKISVSITHSEKDRIEIIKSDDDIKTMPTTRAECSKCGNKQAAYWQVQTRSADEGMTTFFRCLKCKYTWRAY